MTHPRIRATDTPHGLTSPKRPWMKFYPSDWRGNPLLATCSLAARGLLTEMMCLMHAADPYGHLLINGSAPSDAELTRLVRATSVTELRRVRQELVDHGVLSLTADGVLYSRRMVRDAATAAKKRADGKKGGNPRLRRPHLLALSRPSDDVAAVNDFTNQNAASEVNHDLNQQVKPHIPDAIFQNPQPPSGAVRDERIDEIAGAFLECYPAVYARCRTRDLPSVPHQAGP